MDVGAQGQHADDTPAWLRAASSGEDSHRAACWCQPFNGTGSSWRVTSGRGRKKSSPVRGWRAIMITEMAVCRVHTWRAGGVTDVRWKTSRLGWGRAANGETWYSMQTRKGRCVQPAE